MKDKVLIITPCSQRKRQGDVAGLTWKREMSVLGKLSPKSADRLMESRRVLQKRFRYREGKDLGGPVRGTIPLMPAHARYDGNLYRKIDESLWSRLAGAVSVDLLIVSSLYGLLTPEEAIRAYDMPMSRTVRMGVPIKKWWMSRGMLSLLGEYIRRNGYSLVHDFLGGSFVQLADFHDSEPLLSFGKNLRLIRHNYAGLGSGAEHHRGKDVRRLLEKYLS